jgi:MFS transporter, SET family, sugar efflux transporter
VTALRTVFATPVFRMLAGVIGLMGLINASLYPYQSVIGIEVLGLSEPMFALVLVLASGVAVVTSVLLGILSDQKANRRRLAVMTALIGAVGAGLMVFAPGQVSFVLTNGILLPIASSIFGQAFALNRLASQGYPAEREGIQATVRAAMSVTFLMMLVLWTFAFGWGADVMLTYATGGAASLALVALIWWAWPRDGQTGWADQPSGLRLGAALAQLARPAVALRLLCLGAVTSSGVLYMILAGLVFSETPGRDAADTALYIGMVAGWEVPFMLLLPRYLSHIPRPTLIFWGTVLYVSHLVALPFLAGSVWIWAMTLPAGLGGVAMLILPISYYQDLMVGRPGTAASMLALQKLVADMMAALAFSAGVAIGGYALTAGLGGGIAIAGGLGLWLADRARVSPHPA